MEEVYKDCRRSYKDVRKNTRVDFTEIARKKTILPYIVSEFPNLQIRVRTLAISSLFLNSPFTSTTFPYSSNSVQRSFGSFAALTAIILRLLNIDVSPVSAPAYALLGKSSGSRAFLLVLEFPPQSFSCHFSFVELAELLRFGVTELLKPNARLLECGGRKGTVEGVELGQRKSRLTKLACSVVCCGLALKTQVELFLGKFAAAHAGAGADKELAWLKLKPGRGFVLK